MPDNVETERKFLVTDAEFVRRLMADDQAGHHFRQGYLFDRQGVSGRVRHAVDSAFITFKGARRGATRMEYEQEIPVALADILLGVCEGTAVEKVRFDVPEAGLAWTVDVFTGRNEGLVMAELEDPPDDLTPPSWCGAEVTDDERFYNLSLSTAPFASWADADRWRVPWRP